MAIGPIDPDEYFTTDPGIPFHLLRRQKPNTATASATATDPTGAGAVPGAAALGPHGLDEMYVKFSDKNIKEGLSSFLPDLPGYIDAPGTSDTSLQSLIDKPPVGGRELLALTDTALQGFFLMPGSVPDQYKFMNKPPEKKKKKKHKHHDNDHHAGNSTAGAAGTAASGAPGESLAERKQRKRKLKEEGGGGKKKEKKRKKKKSISSS